MLAALDGGKLFMPETAGPQAAGADAAPGPVGRESRGRWWKLLPALGGVALFIVALWGLYGELRHTDYRLIADSVHAMPRRQVALALLATMLSYLVLTLYDQLGFRYIGAALPWRRIATASFIGYALGNVACNAMAAGAAVRYWIYHSFGVSTANVTRIVLFSSAGFWLGYVFLGALLFIAVPLTPQAMAALPFPAVRSLGLLLLALLLAYLLLVIRGRPVHLPKRELRLPTLRFTLGQIAVSTLDIVTMSAGLWLLLPPLPDLPYPHFLQLFMIALLAGAASQVPAGLGVFESAFLLLLPPQEATQQTVAALVVFRAVYYLLPLVASTLLVVLHEARAHRVQVRQVSMRLVSRLTDALPQALATIIFLAGAMLLFSGALPAAGGRLEWLGHLEPLSVIEVSHFLASLTGMALLLLAHGLQRRLDAAYLLTMAMLASGMLLSLAKGFDYEEALLLGLVMAVLAPCRRHFYRRASLLARLPSWNWAASIAVTLAGSAWLYSFSFKHVEYSNQQWWRFALDAEAPRALRATVGAMVLAVAFAASRLLRPARPTVECASEQDIARARPVIAASPWTYANLVLRRDKAMLFSSSGQGFLMYQRMGHSWVAMGDPVGSGADAAELIQRFRAQCDYYGDFPVFFEVRPENIELYLDAGLTLSKLGEEARVALRDFDLAAPRHARLRQACSKLNRLGFAFELVEKQRVPVLMDALRRISEAWLAGKTTREKQFSNAGFDASYLREFPVAVVRHGDDIIAFANVWTTAQKEELSIDLMRHLPSSPHGTMDFLFARLMLWGREQGYAWFNFGMAPLSGLARQGDRALWQRFGTLLYRYGEHFYNFQGLRRYKQKFDPVWTPRYLACPGGVALPSALLDVAALTAGGYSGMLAK